MGSPCDLLLAELDKGLSGITTISDGLKSQVDGMMSALEDVTGIPLNDIEQAADEVGGAVVAEAEETGSVLDSLVDGADCGMADACIDGIISAVKDLVSLDIPSLPSLPDIPGLNDAMAFVDGFCNDVNAFGTELLQFGIDKIVASLDGYINCLDGNPDGPDPAALQERMDKLTGVLDDLKLDDTGNLSMDAIYDGVDSAYSEATTMVTDTKTAVTEAVKDKAISIIPTTKKALPVNLF